MLPALLAAGSVISGLINSGRSLPTVDMGAILNTIQQNRQTNTSLINELPESLKPLYEQYAASLQGAGNQLRTDTNNIGQNLLDQTTALYDPNSAAVQATLAALKQQDYSTLPGTLNALRSQLAATGGLARGGASRAITEAVLAPAAQYSQQAANTQANQLNLQQTNVQAALNKIAQMDDQTSQNIFGMSKEQAANILQFGRQDLQNQLADLINTNNSAAAATEGAYGVSANNAYQNAVTRNAQQEAIVNGLVNTGANVADSMFSGSSAAPAYNGDYADLYQQGLVSRAPGGVMQYRPASMFGGQ